MMHELLRRPADPRLRALIRLGGVSAWVGIAVLSLVPGVDRPHTGFSGNIEHFVAYTIAGTVAGLGFPALRGPVGALLFSAAAALFELSQTVIPGRHPGLDNWAASSAGGVVGLAVAVALLRLRRLIPA